MYRGATDSTMKVVTNDLVLHINAGMEGSYPTSGTTWRDISGNNNHFTLINGPTFSTGYGGELQFDGVNDYARLKNAVGLPISTGTIEIWIRSLANGDGFGTDSYGRALSFSNSTTVGSDTGGATGTYNDATTYLTLLKNTTADNLSYMVARDVNGVGSGSIQFYKNSNTGLVNADGLYRHIVFTWSSSGSNRSVSSYINNSNNGNDTYSYTNFIPSDLSSITIAMQSDASNTNPYSRVKCAVGALRIYNRALSATEVGQNWTVEKRRFGR